MEVVEIELSDYCPTIKSTEIKDQSWWIELDGKPFQCTKTTIKFIAESKENAIQKLGKSINLIKSIKFNN